MENVKQNTMKHKILFIFSFIVLTLLLFNTNVFASYDVTYEGVTYNVPDLPREVAEGEDLTIIKTNKTSQPYVICYSTGLEKIYINYAIGGVNTTKFALKSSTGGSENGINKVYNSKSDLSWVEYYTPYECTPTVIYSTVDVYINNYDSSVQTLVFQPPVQGMTLAQVLAETQKSNPELTLAEIAKIVTLILAVVVSLVGFRKAWKLLRTSLNRS